MRKLLLTAFALSILQTSATAQRFKTAELDTLFNRLARHNKAMGSALIAKNGKILYQRGFGQAELNKHPNKPETVFRIGSISKTFTAALIFRLIEDKKLNLADPLAKWYPQIPNAAKITIDDLLTHHSGIHNFTEEPDFMEWQSAPRSKADIIAKIAAYKSDFAPGEKAEYSNSNFVVLGYIIEEVTGKPYAENLRTRLTQPLGLTHTAMGGSIAPERGEALPYVVENGVWAPDPPSSAEVAGAAGGITSTVGDMAKFMDALFLHHYLSDASFNKMKELRDGYGRGLMPFLSTTITRMATAGTSTISPPALASFQRIARSSAWPAMASTTL